MSEWNSIETTYYQRNRDVIEQKQSKGRAKTCYENNKKVLKDKTKD